MEALALAEAVVEALVVVIEEASVDEAAAEVSVLFQSLLARIQSLDGLWIIPRCHFHARMSLLTRLLGGRGGAGGRGAPRGGGRGAPRGGRGGGRGGRGGGPGGAGGKKVIV